MNRSQQFLLLSALMLIPIGLTYGAIPEGSMKTLFGLEIESPDPSLVHMLRGMAGIYCGMGLFWTAGAFRNSITVPALWSVAIFMSGVAAGRIFGFFVDGIPSFWGFTFFCFSELLLAVAAFIFINKSRAAHVANPS